MELFKNIKTYYLYSIFADLLILGPIIIPYYLARGLTFTQIMIIQSVASISIFVFEVPTGALADRVSRKFSLIIGSSLWALSLVLFIIGPGFGVFLLSEIIFSLGLTLRSGADVALIYDSLKLEGNEKIFQRVEGKAQSLVFYSQAMGSILAGFLFEINIHLPMAVSVIFMVITVIISLNFKEPPHERKQHTLKSTYFDQIKDAGKYVMNHEKIKALILFSVVFYIFYRTGFWFFTPYMEAVNIPVRYFGILFFLFNMTAAFTSRKIHVIMEKTKPRTLTVLASLMIISFVIMGLVKIWVGVFAILLQQVARGMYRPVIKKYLNKHIPSEQRATILSFQSLATNIGVAIVAPLAGIIKDSNDIFISHLIFAVTMLFMILVVLNYMNKRLGVREPQPNCSQ